ncbi:MAG: protein translocase subunit SecD [Brachybacterium alimentarium]|uniref:Protein translocase subunit SecD n=1 Tax=Brachybacterium alimentarium TaxID=47845 RepID=A0A2A3YKP9_9MICO|nr:protein translocase subunit SecD [Brachybacterium alimentarium]PCC34213.1 protein translocase subunit SecD [Brachybacterium alimentarium]PCC39884.1 protein translocase subunit SecD [Brachybacterium alimentarium]RCS69810.1 protein translocase subunit SecD [Brachybacterium alimentarium]RCS78570.1 protein translocase subunit SecD [Brachybacterium alimentarium]RCS83822.1 protein translocase subunit SecD [Brachybacterium alimentarium]
MPARRIALLALAVLILLLGGGIGAGVWKGGWQPAPKLALDLEGGTQIILQTTTRDGSAIDAAAMEQAREIIGQRVNAMGVSETEISVQGGTNIVIDVPGQLDQKTSEALRQTASMSFRPVLGIVAPEGSGGASDEGGASDGGAEAGEETSSSEPDPSQLQFEGLLSEDSSLAPADAPADGELQFPAWSMEWMTPEIQTELMEADCTDPSAQQEKTSEAPADEPVVACDPEGTQKFLLGPEVVAGSSIAGSSVAADVNPGGQSTGYYVVNMQFKKDATKSFGDMTSALYGGEGATGAFGIVLDGQVISAPEVQDPSLGGEASISGNFSQEDASQLSDQLRFGALPLEFEVASESQISATLGTDQLEMGLIAGLIGLALVVAYAFAQYRALASVTTASLAIMGLLTYLTLTVLSNIPDIGYRLSLAGVVGMIVAIAFTADSFIVYFERVRDEIRDGRGIVAAVDHGWDRAKRTILASDSVNLLAAVVLYALSTGSVRGFAFVLGVTTVLDLVVVFLFTHPVLQVLVRTRFFGKGHPWSGLDPAMLGRSVPSYAGRGRFRSLAERGDEDEETAREPLAARKARLAREAAERERTGSPSTPAPEARRTSSGADATDTTDDDSEGTSR